MVNLPLKILVLNPKLSFEALETSFVALKSIFKALKSIFEAGVGRKVTRTFCFFARGRQRLVAGGGERQIVTAGHGGTNSCKGWFKKNVRNLMFC
jgi:hypothetical protein